MIAHLHSTVAANLVAVDVAKDWSIALIQEASGRRRSFRFANRFADHNEFVQYLHSLSGTVCIGLEPTGDFHRTIAYRLLAEGFQVVSISSLALSRFREVRFGNWDKNDPKDAQVILAMMARGFVQVYWDPLFSGTHDWQELSNRTSNSPWRARARSIAFFRITYRCTSGVHSLLAFCPIGMVHSLPHTVPDSCCDSQPGSRALHG